MSIPSEASFSSSPIDILSEIVNGSISAASGGYYGSSGNSSHSFTTNNTLSIQDPTAPFRRSALANHPTLLVSWWCTASAVTIILIRIWGRYERAGKLFSEDKIMVLSIIPLLIRMALIHPVLLWGTNNVQTAGLSPHNIYLRSIGSRLVLGSRIFYALFIWMAKFTCSEYLKRITTNAWKPNHERVLHFIRIFLFISFFAVVIATLAECQPFDHYWQVVPDPGPNCRNGYAQLLVMGIADILTDCLLILFPIPIVLRSSIPATRKLGLLVLFGLNIILIAISAYRMPTIIDAHGRQQLRTLWASIEIFAAAAVSNVVVLGSFLRDRGIKKAKYRTTDRESALIEPPQSSINRTMTKVHWGDDSDEDLFRSLRGRMGSVTTEDHQHSPIHPTPTSLFFMTPFDTRSEHLGADSISTRLYSPDSKTLDDATFSTRSDHDPDNPHGEGPSSSSKAASTRYSSSENNDKVAASLPVAADFAVEKRESTPSSISENTSSTIPPRPAFQAFSFGSRSRSRGPAERTERPAPVFSEASIEMADVGGLLNRRLASVAEDEAAGSGSAGGSGSGSIGAGGNNSVGGASFSSTRGIRMARLRLPRLSGAGTSPAPSRSGSPAPRISASRGRSRPAEARRTEDEDVGPMNEASEVKELEFADPGGLLEKK